MKNALSKKERFLRMIPILAASLLVVLSSSSFAATAAVDFPIHQSVPKNAPLSSTQGAFSFVSNFDSKTLEGWRSISGLTPKIASDPSYFGEPSLQSRASASASQIDVASQGFIEGDAFLSFQIAIYGGSGSTGYFGFAGQSGSVALVGVSRGQVVAGSNLSGLQTVGAIPTTGTAYPLGWVYLTGNVYDATTPSNKDAGWLMQIFVDGTEQVAATIPVPNAASYTNAMIETDSGTVYYTDIVVSTYEIPINIPGYNNMEGYGQGSGLLVNLLPAFNQLTAEMTLNNWNTPQQGILSFQINAMNYYGATRSTCGGFFQLGVDLNPDGYIAPWYVPGNNCIAHYFIHSNSPSIQPGIPSPPASHLSLSILYNSSAKAVVFTIEDITTHQIFTSSVPYSGSAFYGSYTQLEFQPCCASYPIEVYQVRATLSNMQIRTLSGQVQALNSSYMLPFVLDAPPTWTLTYYQNSVSGYSQLAS